MLSLASSSPRQLLGGLYSPVSLSRVPEFGLFAVAPRTLLDLLVQVAIAFPTKKLSIYDAGLDTEPITLTYVDLLERAIINAKKLRHSGVVKPGGIVVVYSESHGPNIIWTWSVIAAGGIPAILSPLSNNEKTLVGQLENLDNLFGNPVLLTAELLCPRFESRPKLRIHTFESFDALPEPEVASKELSYETVGNSSLAVILFTSGSTGHSKGVEFTHEQLIESVIAKKEMHGITSATTFMAWNSFDHSANFCELHLNAMFAGADQIMIPPSVMVQRPEAFYEVCSDHEVGYTFAPNFFLSACTKAVTALEYGRKFDFSRLKVLMVGGEANRTDVIVAADNFLHENGAQVHTVKAAYGLSETCSACFYNLRGSTNDVKTGHAFASVGNHLPRGMEMRIVDEQGAVQPRESTGQIQLRGPVIVKKYYNNPTATADCMTADGWFDTGDLGYQDAEGSLVISGRRKEILILNGNNYSSFELEHAIGSSVPSGINPSYVGSFSTWDASIESEGVVIVFNPTAEIARNEREVRKVIDQISRACVAFCSKYPSAVIPLPLSEMPKSTIGKLSRHKLKQFFERGAFQQYVLAKAEPEASKVPLAGPRQYLFAGVLAQKTGRPFTSFGADSSIMTAGIDSLAYLRVKHDIQFQLKLPFTIPLPLLLRTNSIQDLDDAITALEAEHVTGTDGNTRYDPIVTLQKNGWRTPLILLHPGGGEFLNWLGLLPYFPSRPIHAIRARGLQPGETRFDNLTQMLDSYEAGIRRVQPKGPYAFFGLCFGGLLAYELSRRFEATGDEVKFCGGIDNAPKLELINPSSSFKRFLLQLVAFHGIFSLDEATRLEKEVYHDVDEAPELFVDRVMEGFGEQAKGLDLDKAKIAQWMNVLVGAIDIVNTHKPVDRIASYDVFIAGESPNEFQTFDEWKQLLRGWDDLAHSTGYHQVTGNHFNTLSHPYVETLQLQLNRAMAARGV